MRFVEVNQLVKKHLDLKTNFMSTLEAPSPHFLFLLPSKKIIYPNTIDQFYLFLNFIEWHHRLCTTFLPGLFYLTLFCVIQTLLCM